MKLPKQKSENLHLPGQSYSDGPMSPGIPLLQLSISDTAVALNLPKSTLEYECRHNRGPKFFMVGRRKFTTVDLIREWQSSKIAEATNT